MIPPREDKVDAFSSKQVLITHAAGRDITEK